MVQWKKYRRKLKDQNEHELPWLMMLSAADVGRKVLYTEILAELEEWAMNIEEVREALIEWENLSSDKKNQAEYEARLKELRDQLSNLKGYHRMGKKEGLEEGLKEGKERIIRNMLEKGLSISEIVEMTGLSEQEVRNCNKQKHI